MEENQPIEKIDLTACDREPIHIPSSIQPHGILLGLKEPELTIVQISNNTEEAFKINPQNIIRMNLKNLIGENHFQLLKEQLARYEENVKDINPLAITVLSVDKTLAFDAVLHRSDGMLILELEPNILRNTNHVDLFHKKMTNLILKIQQQKPMQELLKIVTQEVAAMTGFDRVMIYQFEEEGHGAVIAETKRNDLESYVGLHYPASDIPKQARVLYVRNWIRLICDVNYKPAYLIPPLNPLTHQPLDLSFSALRSVSPIHIQYLKNMGVEASMSISLMKNDELIGLIACHHCSPKFIPYEIRSACEFLGQLLSYQIVNRNIEIRNQLLIKNHDHIVQLREKMIGAQDWFSTLMSSREMLLQLMDAQGLAICYKERSCLIGKTPSEKDVKQLTHHLDVINNAPVFYTNSLTKVYPDAEKFKDVASGVFAIFLGQSANDSILWFRPEIIYTVNWAGNPNKPVSIIKEAQQLTPRQSFALWKEEVRLKSTPWSDAEQRIAVELRQNLMEIIASQARKKTEDEQRKQQEEFIDTICHEVRNPINGIIGSLEMLKERLEMIQQSIGRSRMSEAENILGELSLAKNYAEDIMACAEHQTFITNDVLNLSKLEASKTELENELFNINDTFTKATNMFLNKIKKLGLELKLILPKEPLIIVGDSHRLTQVIINLLSNAIKFTKKGTITLSLTSTPSIKETHECLHISIEDTGIGMTEEETKYLFQKFSQASSKISNEYGGTGLGLLISRNLVQLMGGDIQVESKKGLGTKFSFTIHCQKSLEKGLDKKEETHHDTIPIVQEAGARKILIADDNELNQRLLVNILTKAGYECQVASNGKEVLEKFSATIFDLILMDLEMPVMNGYEAIRLIRKKEKESSSCPIPIICISASPIEKFKQRALEAGANEYINKPIKKDEILKIVNKLSRRHIVLTSESSLSENHKYAGLFRPSTVGTKDEQSPSLRRKTI